MNQGIVNTSSIIELTLEINSIISKMNQELGEIESNNADLNSLLSTLKNFNGQIVTGTEKNSTSQDGDVINYCHSYKTWKVSGCDTVLRLNKDVLERVSNLIEIIPKISNFVHNSQIIAEQISTDIDSINGQLANFTPEQRQILLDSIKNYKAEDGYSVANGNYVGIDPENERWWTDDAMYGRYDSETGTILVYQLVNGAEVGMGWVPLDKWMQGVGNAVQSGNQLEISTKQKLAEVGKEVGGTLFGAGAVIFNSIANNAGSYTLVKNISREENGDYKIEYNNGETKLFDRDGNLIITVEKSEQTNVPEEIEPHSQGENSEKEYFSSNFNEEETTATQYFDEKGDAIKNEVNDSQGQTVSAYNSNVNNVNSDVEIKNGVNPTEIIYNDDGTIDTFLNTFDHDRLLILHKDPNTGLEINYSPNGEYQASINGKIFNSGNQANGDFISVDGNHVTIYKNNKIVNTTTLAVAEQSASMPEMIFDSESQNFIDPIEISDDSSTVSYADNIPSEVATFDSDTGKFTYGTIDENGNTITTDENGNTTTIDANGYKTTVKADGSIVEELF